MHERISLIAEVWRKQSLTVNLVHAADYGVLPFEDDAFDLSWNFASLWFVDDLDVFMDELTRVTRHAIFVCVPNRFGLGYLSRSLFSKTPSEGLQVRNIHPRTIKKTMAERGWTVFKEGLFDVPPWPDIAMKKEDLLRDIGLKWVAKRLAARPGEGMCILDYYSGKNKGMEQDILKYAFLENSPWLVKRFWAHHWYAIFTPCQF
jgi:SAM-dependent methyltransferase